jgi:hypothetical protein
MAGWLEGELAAVRGELARVDAKCGVLTAVATGAAAFTATQAGHGPLAARVILAAAGVTFAAAVLILLPAPSGPDSGTPDGADTGRCPPRTWPGWAPAASRHRDSARRPRAT